MRFRNSLQMPDPAFQYGTVSRGQILARYQCQWGVLSSDYHETSEDINEIVLLKIAMIPEQHRCLWRSTGAASQYASQ